MIKDNIQNAEKYFNISPRIKKGLEYLQKTDLKSMPEGRYEIDGENIFVSVQNYLSKSEAEGKFEAHRKYIDIQFVIQGEEKIGVAKLDECSANTDYNEEKDIIFLNKNIDASFDFINLKSEEFVILNPEHAHMPCIFIDSAKPVKKAVVKVKI